MLIRFFTDKRVLTYIINKIPFWIFFVVLVIAYIDIADFNFINFVKDALIKPFQSTSEFEDFLNLNYVVNLTLIIAFLLWITYSIVNLGFFIFRHQNIGMMIIGLMWSSSNDITVKKHAMTPIKYGIGWMIYFIGLTAIFVFLNGWWSLAIIAFFKILEVTFFWVFKINFMQKITSMVIVDYSYIASDFVDLEKIAGIKALEKAKKDKVKSTIDFKIDDKTDVLIFDEEKDN